MAAIRSESAASPAPDVSSWTSDERQTPGPLPPSLLFSTCSGEPALYPQLPPLGSLEVTYFPTQLQDALHEPVEGLCTSYSHRATHTEREGHNLTSGRDLRSCAAAWPKPRRRSGPQRQCRLLSALTLSLGLCYEGLGMQRHTVLIKDRPG